jgi:hypothetical protein
MKEKKTIALRELMKGIYFWSSVDAEDETGLTAREREKIIRGLIKDFLKNLGTPTQL